MRLFKPRSWKESSGGCWYCGKPLEVDPEYNIPVNYWYSLESIAPHVRPIYRCMRFWCCVGRFLQGQYVHPPKKERKDAQ